MEWAMTRRGMPTDYTIDRERGLVRVVASGRLSDNDFLEQRVRLRSDPAFDAAYSFSVDLRQVTELALSALVISRLARDPISDPGIRRAIILPAEGDAGPEPLAFGLSRVFQSIAALRGEDVELFVDSEAAERWLRRER